MEGELQDPEYLLVLNKNSLLKSVTSRFWIQCYPLITGASLDTIFLNSLCLVQSN